jgi:hypothetical protein
MSEINLRIFPVTPISIRIIEPGDQLFYVRRLGLPDTPISLTVYPQATFNGDVYTTNVSATGTLNEIEITADAYNNLTIGLPDNVVIANDLDVGGVVSAPTFDGELLGTVSVQVKNTSGQTINKGMPVYPTGTVGSTHVVEIAAAPATANAEAIGLAGEDMINNAFGHVVQQGVLEDVDTNVTNWSVGTKLYLAASLATPSTTTKNYLTSTYPPKGTNTQHIGTVIRKNANNGSIFVHAAGQEMIANNMRLGDLVNVNEAQGGPQVYTLLLARTAGSTTWSEISGEVYASASHNHNLINDTYIPPAQSTAWNGKVPVWDGVNDQWVNGTPPFGASLGSGAIPLWNGTAWQSVYAPTTYTFTLSNSVPLYLGSNNWKQTELDGPTSRAFVESECFTAQDLTFYTSGGGSNSVSTVSAQDGHPGILYSSTAGSATGVAGIGMVTTNQGVVLGTHKHVFDSVILLPGLSTNSEKFEVMFGCADSRTATPANGVTFTYTNTQNSGAWTMNIWDNNTLTSYNSGVTVAANTWYHLRISVIVAGSNLLVEGLINGTIYCQAVVSGPKTSSKPMSLVNHIRKTTGTAVSALWTDYVSARTEFATDR